MTYTIKKTTRFKKEFKLCIRRGNKIEKFCEVLNLLKNGLSLPSKYQDHSLQSSKLFKNCRELHIEPDWVLVYKYSKDNLILWLVGTGTHSDLFR